MIFSELPDFARLSRDFCALVVLQAFLFAHLYSALLSALMLLKMSSIAWVSVR
ncbi:hypothetical protein D3C75_877420 [compost metagenome]